jgi:hypothetical protein
VVILSDADRQRVHRQQDKGQDEHAARSGPDSGFHGRVHAVLASNYGIRHSRDRGEIIRFVRQIVVLVRVPNE